jgi:hypothetical protein
MPYFEVPGLFFEAFEAFLKGAQQSGQVGG